MLLPALCSMCVLINNLCVMRIRFCKGVLICFSKRRNKWLKAVWGSPCIFEYVDSLLFLPLFPHPQQNSQSLSLPLPHTYMSSSSTYKPFSLLLLFFEAVAFSAIVMQRDGKAWDPRRAGLPSRTLPSRLG